MAVGMMSKPPLWVCVHETGHAIARIQLQTNLLTADREPAYPITNPAFEEIAVTIDAHVQNRTYWRGWVKNLPDRNLRLWENEAVACAAGPVAEQRVRKKHGLSTLMGFVKVYRHQKGSDWANMWQCSRHGVSIQETFETADWIIGECWPHVVALARHLQFAGALSFSEVSDLLRLGDPLGMTSIYD